MSRIKLWVNLLLIATAVFISGCEFKDVHLESIEQIEIGSLKGGKIDGVIHMVLENPNGFAIKVKSAEFDLMTGNVQLGRAVLKDGFRIEPNTTKSYAVSLTGDLSNALAGGFVGLTGLLTGKKPKLTVKGELKAGNFFYTKQVPIDFETEMPLNL
jgi:LEA14-like dessication related protein